MTFIQMTFTSPEGGLHQNAMFVVRSVTLDILLGSGTYTVEGYTDTSYLAAKNPFHRHTGTFSSPPNPANTSAQNIALIYQNELAQPMFATGASLVTQ